MFAVTLAASMSFMLPVATPPNAMVFASGHIITTYMASTGLLMNVFGVLVITLLCYLLIGSINI